MLEIIFPASSSNTQLTNQYLLGITGLTTWLVAFPPGAFADQNYTIPSWIKNNAKWWSEGQLQDSDFTKGIEYLIQQGIMTIPKTTPISTTSHGIPAWIKNNAGWWASGQIDDSQFVKGIEYLVQAGIIQVSQAGNVQPQTSYSLAFFLNYEQPDYQDTLQILSKHLRSGDYVLVLSGQASPSAKSLLPQKVQEIKSVMPQGVNVFSTVVYRSISQIDKVLSTTPSKVDYIQYDYEKSTPKGGIYSPEFTTDVTTANGYFDQAKTSIQKYNSATESNAKLMVDPPYWQLNGPNWDWGLAAQHMDLINIQFQFIMKDPNLHDLVAATVGQIQLKSPNTMTFIQLTINPKLATVQQCVNTINKLNDIQGINAYLIIRINSNSTQLEEFFSQLNR